MKVTLKQLDAAKKKRDKVVESANKTYNKLWSKYVETCPHTRIRSSYSNWSQNTSYYCYICFKSIEKN